MNDGDARLFCDQDPGDHELYLRLVDSVIQGPASISQTEAEARLGIESWQHCRSIRSRPETVISQSEARIAPSQPMRSRDWEAPERSQSSPEPRRRVRLVEPERPHREPRTLRLRDQGKQE